MNNQVISPNKFLSSLRERKSRDDARLAVGEKDVRAIRRGSIIYSTCLLACLVACSLENRRILTPRVNECLAVTYENVAHVFAYSNLIVSAPAIYNHRNICTPNIYFLSAVCALLIKFKIIPY